MLLKEAINKINKRPSIHTFANNFLRIRIEEFRSGRNKTK